jgi:hypothetical protein
MSVRERGLEFERAMESIRTARNNLVAAYGGVLREIDMLTYQLDNLIPSIHAKDPTTAERLRAILSDIRKKLSLAAGTY